MLQAARETSDSLMAQATERSDRMLADARAEANRLSTEGKATASRLRADAETYARTKRAEIDAYAQATKEEADTYARKVGQPKAPVTVAPNGLAPEEFVRVAPHPNARDFLFIGALRDLKGVDVFIEALTMLREITDPYQ